ncbi:hypothetical protein KBY24_00265 [Ruegeria pomeroyi]|uniref:Type IV pilus biogenesis n=1 Tax=Ruegeria alba TaxID=2916756 RepID=A0ABS9NYH0_9RHOB|nr:hypothetical protein [Ruegeria alba]MCE8519408.1 hypothetical protein [Ruegeria pomeroyi]MCE8524459.1 hypothetical protein [Ruegeria pomeroyi]MCE8531808.1 hypothetical protein [Ruegeria pomeroyi]MCE8545722.1 hypothetical protein [Ruegeria pomeroyi]MCG6559283.1 hypothetical protein [Ruegeria alba]
MANGIVEEAATQAAKIRANTLTVLGVFGPSGDLRALVRLPGGKVEEVSPGDRTRAGEVLGIDAEGVVLRHGGRTRRVDIAGG